MKARFLRMQMPKPMQAPRRFGSLRPWRSATGFLNTAQNAGPQVDFVLLHRPAPAREPVRQTVRIQQAVHQLLQVQLQLRTQVHLHRLEMTAAFRPLRGLDTPSASLLVHAYAWNAVHRAVQQGQTSAPPTRLLLRDVSRLVQSLQFHRTAVDIAAAPGAHWLRERRMLRSATTTHAQHRETVLREHAARQEDRDETQRPTRRVLLFCMHQAVQRTARHTAHRELHSTHHHTALVTHALGRRSALTSTQRTTHQTTQQTTHPATHIATRLAPRLAIQSAAPAASVPAAAPAPARALAAPGPHSTIATPIAPLLQRKPPHAHAPLPMVLRHPPRPRQEQRPPIDIVEIERRVQRRIVQELRQPGQVQDDLRRTLVEATLTPQLLQVMTERVVAAIDHRDAIERYRRGRF